MHNIMCAADLATQYSFSQMEYAFICGEGREAYNLAMLGMGYAIPDGAGGIYLVQASVLCATLATLVLVLLLWAVTGVFLSEFFGRDLQDYVPFGI